MSAWREACRDRRGPSIAVPLHVSGRHACKEEAVRKGVVTGRKGEESKRRGPRGATRVRGEDKVQGYV